MRYLVATLALLALVACKEDVQVTTDEVATVTETVTQTETVEVIKDPAEVEKQVTNNANVELYDSIDGIEAEFMSYGGKSDKGAFNQEHYQGNLAALGFPLYSDLKAGDLDDIGFEYRVDFGQELPRIQLQIDQACDGFDSSQGDYLLVYRVVTPSSTWKSVSINRSTQLRKNDGGHTVRLQDIPNACIVNGDTGLNTQPKNVSTAAIQVYVGGHNVTKGFHVSVRKFVIDFRGNL